jgi:uncharacterized protein (DUF885 family)
VRRRTLIGAAAPVFLAGAAGLAGCVPRSAQEAGARLRALLDASDEAALQRNPIAGWWRGDARFLARHGNTLTDAAIEAERRAAERDLAALSAIPRERLSPADRIARDTFAQARRDALELASPPAVRLWSRLPIDQHDGWHLEFADLSAGQSVLPYRTLSDHEAGFARIDGHLGWLGTVVQRLRQGRDEGVVPPRFVVEKLLVQLDAMLARPAEQWPPWQPAVALQGVPTARHDEFRRRYRAAIDDGLRPAWAQLRDVLRSEVLPAARTTVGLAALPGGADHYAMLLRHHTTTGLDAARIHALGRAEVERIAAGMREVMRTVRWEGGLPAFFEHLRTDARFRPSSAEALAEGYRAIGRRVDAALPRLFDRRPGMALEIRPIPDDLAPTAAGAYYTSGSAETGTPGVFYFNAHDLPSRSTWGMETLYLHEAVPGHHHQGAIASENESLPNLLRHEGNSAYWEGWALYAEGLGAELGLFTDPYQRFGWLNDEMLRAMRLVVDTGLHAFGWTREQAIDYLLANSAMGRTDAVSEAERYIVNPGQACAYMVGALTIRRLRAEAEQRLGARFDLRAFHAQVLDTGAVPLAVLEAKLADWVAGRT